MLLWDIGKLNPQKLPNLRGSLSMQMGAPKPEENPSLNIDLKIQQLAISGNVQRTTSSKSKFKTVASVCSGRPFLVLDLCSTALHLLCRSQSEPSRHVRREVQAV